MPRQMLELDSKIALALRAQRALRGMSQADLGAKIGVSFQQIQKYEHGTNKISASRLWAIAEALGCQFTDLISPPPLLLASNETKSIVDMVKLYHNLSARQRELLRDFAHDLATAG